MKGTNVLDMIRGALAPLGLVVSVVDRTLAAGSIHNAREAAGDSKLRRASWSGVMIHRDHRKTASVA